MKNSSLESYREDQISMIKTAIDRYETATNPVNRFIGKIVIAHRKHGVHKIDRMIEERQNLVPMWQLPAHFILSSAEASLVLPIAQEARVDGESASHPNGECSADEC